ncbi:hypothetical protein PR048_027443, partial [Dryococelus australis]
MLFAKESLQGSHRRPFVLETRLPTTPGYATARSRNVQQRTDTITAAQSSPWASAANQYSIIVMEAQGNLNFKWGRGGVVVRLLASHPGERSSIHGGATHYQTFARGDRAGRYCWSMGFLGGLTFPPPLHSADPPYSPCFTFIDSQDIDTFISLPLYGRWRDSLRGLPEKFLKIILTQTSFSVTLKTLGGATVAERLARSPPTKAIRPVNSGIFACGNSGGRCHWSAGFLGDLPFPPPQSPSSALKTSMLRAAQIFPLFTKNTRIRIVFFFGTPFCRL